ncbi:MAG: DUF1801 domain-containing protein [Chitinophagaceae bacterium]|nr:DUF1801 domain-containing protein [Chitinophagaceae bacterium]
MAKLKTTFTGKDVSAFIESCTDDRQKQKDSFELIQIFRELTKQEPKMWGQSIVGFGSYHYKYQSGHEGDAPRLAFSPRKSAISLYVYTETEKNKSLLKDLGIYKMGKACIYIKKLSDINKAVLKEICAETLRYLSEKYS